MVTLLFDRKIHRVFIFHQILIDENISTVSQIKLRHQHNIHIQRETKTEKTKESYPQASTSTILTHVFQPQYTYIIPALDEYVRLWRSMRNAMDPMLYVVHQVGKQAFEIVAPSSPSRSRPSLATVDRAGPSNEPLGVAITSHHSRSTP